jgi:hypothetical protein
MLDAVRLVRNDLTTTYGRFPSLQLADLHISQEYNLEEIIDSDMYRKRMKNNVG